MDVGDINVYYGSNGELLYQRWDGNQWSEPAPMMAETVEVLSLKSRIKRLEVALKPFIEKADAIPVYQDNLIPQVKLDVSILRKAQEAYYDGF